MNTLSSTVTGEITSIVKPSAVYAHQVVKWQEHEDAIRLQIRCKGKKYAFTTILVRDHATHASAPAFDKLVLGAMVTYRKYKDAKGELVGRVLKVEVPEL